MNPYSHLVIASHLEHLAAPDNPPDYYWGAIAPDIRYLSAIQRSQTHLPPQEIISFFTRYPHLISFLQGYLVHCLTDEIPLEEVFFNHHPFAILKSRLSRRHLAVILELFNFETSDTNIQVSGTYNEVLEKIGLKEKDCAKFAGFIDRYTASSTSADRIADLTRLLGLEHDSRIEQYAAAAEGFQRNWFLRNTLFFGIRAGKINDQLTKRISAKMKAMVIR